MKNGDRKVLASFREIPAVCISKVKEIYSTMREKGFQGILIFGEPNQSLLDIPVGIDRLGIVVVEGLNPIAAVEEAGIQTENC